MEAKGTFWTRQTDKSWLLASGWNLLIAFLYRKSIKDVILLTDPVFTENKTT